MLGVLQPPLIQLSGHIATSQLVSNHPSLQEQSEGATHTPLTQSGQDGVVQFSPLYPGIQEHVFGTAHVPFSKSHPDLHGTILIDRVNNFVHILFPLLPCVNFLHTPRYYTIVLYTQNY